MEEIKGTWISEQADEILEYLKTTHYEEIRAVKCGVICELFNLKKENLRAVVNHLRSEGHPVCSSDRGYWCSEKPEDMDKTLNHLEGRISGMMRAITGLKRIRSGE